MPRPCSICARSDRDAIDTAIVAHDETYRTVAARYGITERSLQRHKQGHTLALRQRVEKIAVAAEARLDARVERVQELRSVYATRVDRYREAAEDILESAKEKGRWMSAVNAIDRCAALAKQGAILSGEYVEQPGTQLNVAIVQSDGWKAIREAILEALTPYPEARAAVVERLGTLDAPRISAA